MVRISILTLVLGFFNFSFAQNPTTHYEGFYGVTPCYTAWYPSGNFQGFTGHDMVKAAYNSSEGALVIDIKTHESQHSPLYYILSKGGDLVCEPGLGIVDISNPASFLGMRIKASEKMQIVVYVQEGNNASWDYTKLGANPIVLNVDTQYQIFCKNITSTNPAVGNTSIDLTNIGGLAFELGKTDGVNFDQVDGEIYIDFVYFGNYFESDMCTPFSVSKTTYFNYNLFPNPNNGTFSIELAESLNSTIKIIGLNGNVIEVIKSKGRRKVDYNNLLPEGLYFVHIETSKGIEVAKMVVR